MATASSAISRPHNLRQIPPEEEQAAPSAVTIIAAKINEYLRYSREYLEGLILGRIADAEELHPFIATSLKNVGKVALIGGALLLGLKCCPAWTALIGLWWAMSNIATTQERVEPKVTLLAPPKIISPRSFLRPVSSSPIDKLSPKAAILGSPFSYADVVKRWQNVKALASALTPSDQLLSSEVGSYRKLRAGRGELPKITISQGDMIQAAIQSQSQGEKTALVNFANPLRPGGFVGLIDNDHVPSRIKKSTNVLLPQEEQIFLSSNAYLFLDPSKNRILADRMGDHYQIPENGVVYSSEVSFFTPQGNVAIDLISCAAYDLRQGIPENYEERTKEKIRQMIRGSLLHNCKRLILGPFGCGIYQNPSRVMARYMKEVLLEEEFRGSGLEVLFVLPRDKTGADFQDELTAPNSVPSSSSSAAAVSSSAVGDSLYARHRIRS